MKLTQTTQYKTRIPYVVFGDSVEVLQNGGSLTIDQIPPAAKALFGSQEGAKLEFEPTSNRVFVCLPEVAESLDTTITPEELGAIRTILEDASLADKYDAEIVASIAAPYLFLKYGSLDEAVKQTEEVGRLLSISSSDTKYVFKEYRETAAKKNLERTAYGATRNDPLASLAAAFSVKTVDPWPDVDTAIARIVGRENPICVAELNCGQGGDLYSIALLAETGLEGEDGQIVTIHGVGYGECLSDLYQLYSLKRTAKGSDRDLTIRGARGRTIKPADFFREVEGGIELDTGRLKHVSVDFHPVLANIYDAETFKKLVSVFPSPHVVCRTDLAMYQEGSVQLSGTQHTVAP